MHFRQIAGYVVGQADAIRTLAQNRATLATGLLLVLLTAVARRYDQVLITEEPWRWLFGPLVFSLISGTWLYLIAYRVCARPRRTDAAAAPSESESTWLQFMGLFWMTAPIAWLYAIPVERWLDSVAAAQVNVALLAMVSLWRVLLLARVFQVLSGRPFGLTLCWVWVPASIEALAIFFVSGTFARALVAGMGGLRNSPEEDILIAASNFAFTAALLTLPLALIGACFERNRTVSRPWPATHPGRLPWPMLALVGSFWIIVAIGPQRELANNVAAERLAAEGRMREALDYLSARKPGDFAPARPLPPKPFEREVFEQLPALFAVLQPSDPAWVREHLIRRLNDMCIHLRPRQPRGAGSLREFTAESVIAGLRWHGPEGAGWSALLAGLERIEEGRSWIGTNRSLLHGLLAAAADPRVPVSHKAQSQSEDFLNSDWMELRKRLDKLGITKTSTTGNSGLSP